jgi:hypothetical protein
MRLAEVTSSADPEHRTACPFVLPGAPLPPPVQALAGDPDLQVLS